MMPPSTELSLLLDSILNTSFVDIGEEMEIRQEKLFNLLYYHQIRPSFLSYVHEKNIPIAFKKRLTRDCQQIALGNMMSTQELMRLHSLLKDNNVPVYVYKGSLWAEWLYDSIGKREFGDIDLLIPQTHFPEAIRLLVEEGQYKADDYREHLLQSRWRDKFFKTDYHIPMMREFDDTRNVVEAHWNIAYPRLLFQFPSGEWDTYAETYSLLNKEVLGFKNEYQFLVLLVHHGGKEEWKKMKYIADLAAYMQKYGDSTDWAQLSRLAAQKGIHNLYIQSLSLLKSLGILWKPGWPQGISTIPVQSLLNTWESTPKLPANSSWPYFKRGLAIHDGFKYKGLLILEHLKYLTEFSLLLHKSRWYKKSS
jgi:hypothetical protein